MDISRIVTDELHTYPRTYTRRETDELRNHLHEHGYDMETFFESMTKEGLFVCSSRVPIEDTLQVCYSNYAVDGQQYLHYMKVPYFAFITALHEKLDFTGHIDHEKVKQYEKTVGDTIDLEGHIYSFSMNPNVSYLTEPDMPRGVNFESFFIPEVMDISVDQYIDMIREQGLREEGYIYVVEDHGMTPSHRYPDMEFHCFKDIPFLARIPISREKDWQYETRIVVQQIPLSGLHITS